MVAADIAHHPLDIALVIPFAGPPVAVSEQVVRQQPAEQRGPHPRAIRLDLRDQAAVVVIENRLRHPAKEGKGMHMPVHPGLRRGRRGLLPKKWSTF